jgi:hypothetical protein
MFKSRKKLEKIQIDPYSAVAYIKKSSVNFCDEFKFAQTAKDEMVKEIFTQIACLHTAVVLQQAASKSDIYPGELLPQLEKYLRPVLEIVYPETNLDNLITHFQLKVQHFYSSDRGLDDFIRWYKVNYRALQFEKFENETIYNKMTMKAIYTISELIGFDTNRFPVVEGRELFMQVNSSVSAALRAYNLEGTDTQWVLDN